MELERNKLYESADDFFRLNGSAVMKLAAAAAIDVCLRAVQHGLLISRVEGGIWHSLGFEARVDCIWDGADPPVDSSVAARNNTEAADFIRKEGVAHDAFVVTSPPITGWPHKQL